VTEASNELLLLSDAAKKWHHASGARWMYRDKPRAGSGAKCTLDSIFDFGAILLFACLYRMLPHLSSFFTFSLLISSLNYLFL